ncbi:hypothetical protein [Streptomyces sp. TRM68367]|uniref:hypothetical protein n=1 Tax=Streptomyces sp. TRM68367 TaxID=2758415 RepID=UPI00165BB8A7|nr:hypothetical protein [Streptomyces sp. TRM68367]MBC9723482.1 hypothetical protein [Streptomyces sp. TRM68367]
MYEYELHQYRSADLLRRADHQRLVREALRARRTARRKATHGTSGTEPHTHDSRYRRFTRAA